MALLDLDTRQWNLTLPLAMLATACGARPVPLGGSGTDSSGTTGPDTTTGPTSDTSPSTTTTTTTTGDPDECKTDADCPGWGYYCVGGQCEYYCYDYCCGAGQVSPGIQVQGQAVDSDQKLRCSPPYYYDCYADADCGPGEWCNMYNGWGGYCEPVITPGQCGEVPPLQPSIPVPDGVDTDIIDLQFMDANGDPAQDLVLAGPNGGQVLLGPADMAPIDLPLGASPSRHIVGLDYDGDSQEELAIASAGWVNIFPAVTGPPSQLIATLSLGAARADLDGDGLDDLVGIDGMNVWALQSNGDDTFTQSHQHPFGAEQIVSVNVDGSGGDDFATVEYNEVTHWIGQGGGFEYWGWWALGAEVSELAAGDFNGDGNMDLVYGNKEGFRIHFSNGTWFSSPGALVATPDQFGLATGDLDGDGADEVIRTVNGEVTVYFAGPGCDATYPLPVIVTRVASGDLDGDGLDDVVAVGDGQIVFLTQ